MTTEKHDYFKDPPPRRVGTLGLLERDGQFVIISRSYWTEVSRWGLPGGTADANELPRRAFSRLMAEKLGGLRVTASALLAVDHSPEWPGRFHEGVNFVYHVPLPSDADVTVTDGRGYVEARWVDEKTVGELAVDHELARILQCLEAVRDGTTKELLVGLPMRI
ncbi:NUDIX domain-containing protein [Nonomuraea sp. SYSU D8015]|uniref:NUDIX domain-containing protein n=1 Tax=Nonomuraea sp. SYSU D8015 TaxID=2593644 RepID=UPI001660D474|nr:NUDIX domain-containing protein [Nonomuraea sp. SYSU D8015]